MAKIDIHAYAERLAALNDHRFMLPVIEKELLHYEILRALSEQGLLSSLTFQGGTCLRLCYGAPRYSEDLDFVGGTKFDANDLAAVKSCIEEALPRKYEIAVDVAEPTAGEFLVKKWRIRIDTTVSRPDIAKQKITFEVASIPAYTRKPKLLQMNYEGIPASYGDIILQAESPEEILADKLESFICAAHVRYRDIWDLFWLKRLPRIDIMAAKAMRSDKADDYGEVDRYERRLPTMIDELPALVESGEFQQQMRRFLPVDVFQSTIARPMFRAAMTEGIQDLYL